MATSPDDDGLAALDRRALEECVRDASTQEPDAEAGVDLRDVPAHRATGAILEREELGRPVHTSMLSQRAFPFAG